MLSNYNIIIPDKNKIDFLNTNEVPRYLKKIKPNTSFIYKYNNGSILVPNIINRLKLFVKENELEEDIQFILKRLRKMINEVTDENRKKGKLLSINNARNKQCTKYNIENTENNLDEYNNNYVYVNINKNNKKIFKRKNKSTIRKSIRLLEKSKTKRTKKRATKYNPYWGSAQLVGSGFT